MLLAEPDSAEPNFDAPSTMRAIVLTGPQEIEIQMLPVPRLRPGHVLIKTAYVGICGADAAMYDGSSNYLQTGRKSYPFVFGHEWAGAVAEVAPDVVKVSPGQRVVGHNFITCENCPYCRAGHTDECTDRSEMGILGDYPGAASEYFQVPSRVLTGLPDTVDLRSAALLEPGSTALHAITRLGVRDDDLVAVFGTGALGLLVLQLAKSLGATVHVVGIDPAGLTLARELGADEVFGPDQVSADAYSAAVEASGAARATVQAAAALRNGGRLALVGLAHGAVDGLVTSDLIIKNARIEAVLSGIHQWDRLISLVACGAVRLEPLLDQVLPFDEAQKAFQLQLSPNRTRPKLLLEFAA